MRIKRLLMATALIAIMACYGCGKPDVKPLSTETSASQESTEDSGETSSVEQAEEEKQEEADSLETAPESESEELIDYGNYFSEVVVTGIDEYSAVGYSIAGFMDGSLFSLEFTDENGTDITGNYEPGLPDKLVFEFDNKTGEVVSALYYGTYPDEDSVALGIEACDANSYLLGDDIVGLAAEDNNIVIAFDPKSARFNNVIRTYFLEGRHDTEGYIESVKKDYESTTRDKSELTGDNFACDVINGLKVSWYK